MKLKRWWLGWLFLATLSSGVGAEPLRVAFFQTDATPPLGSPVAYAPARKIEDPLSARGIVLLGAGEPIVLCGVDWIGIGNTGHDVWREQLARAAGTPVERVTVHTLHQHDGVRCDFSAEELLAAHGMAGKRFDPLFARQTIDRVATAVRRALEHPEPVTHLGIGLAKVEKVASNRRILGPDGKVKIGRMSASRNPAAIAAPEGTIDPVLKMLSFWNGDRPVVCLSYYATHPQSYYGKGDVTAEFVGLARAQRERDLGGLPLVHFNGASGNVAAGKYNDGSPEMRPVLAGRIADGLRRAWEATQREPITAADVAWRIQPVRLPPAAHLDKTRLAQTLADAQAPDTDRLNAATKLAFLARCEQGHEIQLSCLQLKQVHVLHMPGELFVEYQLAAQQMKPDAVVCLAAYGDYGTGYIGTEIAYSQGGYETSPRASNVAPQAEAVLLAGMRALLQLDHQQSAIWELNNLNSIGGHRPEILGAPRLIETAHGKALEFDGQQDALFVDVNPLAGLREFTVEIVFRPDQDGPQEQRFLHFQEGGSENRLLFETRLTSDNRWFLDTFLKSGDGNYTQFAEQSLHAIGPWYHAAVTVDGQRMRHFVNGTEEMSTAVVMAPQASGRTSVGTRINKVYWFKGAIRQVRVTPRVLAPSEFLKP